MQIKTLKELEKDHLFQVLVKTHWNIRKTALLLKIPFSEVRRKIKEHGLKGVRARRVLPDRQPSRSKEEK